MPFTVEQFFDVFHRYNEAVWPVQVLLVLLAVAAVLTALNPHHRLARTPGLILAAMWLWMGVVYQLVFFRPINPAATLFGAVFVVQGVLLAWMALRKDVLVFRLERDADGIAGLLLVIFALVLYPLLGYMSGHRYPSNPTFGLPCPTTIFTFGVLLWARPRAPRIALLIPVLWAIVGTTAALRLGVTEDLGLLPAAIIAILVSHRQAKRSAKLRFA